jgi:signal transduction histidine kinase
MEERMRMLGGGLRIESQAGLGTRLEARVPLDGARA